MFTRVSNGTMRVSIEGAAETLHVVDFRNRQIGCFIIELHIAAVAQGVCFMFVKWEPGGQSWKTNRSLALVSSWSAETG